jgi:uncharacterized protein YukE
VRQQKLWNKEINKLPQMVKDHEKKVKEIQKRSFERKRA